MRRLLALFAACILVFCATVTVTPAAEAQTAYDAIVEGILNCESSIDISRFKISTGDIRALFQKMLYNEPDLFHVQTGYSYTHLGGNVVEFRPKYEMTKEDYIQARVFCDKEIQKILSLAPAELTDIQKALFFHDYICLNYEYDMTYTNHDMYSMLRDKKGVCMSYALLYDMLLQKNGIDSVAVVSTTINHMWNAIELDGEYYHVDTTWDDPVNDKFGRAKHSFFLLSDEAMAATDHGVFENVGASDDRYDGHEWHQSASEFAFVNGKIYYLYEKNVKETSLDSSQSTTCYTIGDKWYVWGKTSWWTGSYSGLGFFKNQLILNSPTEIYAVDPSTGKKTTLLKPDVSKGYVYGLFVYGDTVHYIISESYDYAVSSVHTAKLDFDPSVDTGTKGDISGNGGIDSSDYIMSKRYVLGTFALDEVQIKMGDVNNDGSLNATDYLMLKRHVLGTYVIG